ncbi:MAG: pyrroloquinoline quinone-dependent dehydrogenase [Cytophagaceae bacterium]|nr:pyrroloquinoline quinone-dependent dehydrogenase [Gemmatimonadaceae bacterium]
MRRTNYHVLLIVAACLVLPAKDAAAQRPIEWTAYGATGHGRKYSVAARIDRSNVGRLVKAWEYRTGDLVEGRGRMQVTPIVVAGTMYVATPVGTVIALDPSTGVERWRFAAKVDPTSGFGDFSSRGVSFWRDARAAAGTPCRARIVYATVDARLFSLDAANGQPCAGFGAGGTVDLKAGLRNAPQSRSEYEVTSPPAIIGDLVIVGSAIADNQRTDAPPGVVRAYDARTGALRWAWDPHPPVGTRGSETWQGPSADKTGAANAWSIISVDAERGLVFVPTGSASPDFFGGERLGQNLYANSLVALRAATGEVAWHFQVVHHDLWDYDVASQPVLFTLRRGGRTIPAVAQSTKMGHVFILHRETGAPLFPVEERAVPPSTVPGEVASATQPFPVLPLPLSPASFPLQDIFGVDSTDRAWCTARMTGTRNEGIFTPPSLEGTILYPGNIGGSNWGGVSIDERRQLLVAPTNRVATLIQLVPRDSVPAARRAAPGAEFGVQRGTPYGMLRTFLLAPSGLPCNPPPWGVLTAVDLGTGHVKWERPLGSMPQVAGSPDGALWGSVNLGGALLTGGGLVFVGATLDQKIRAFDVETGAELWAADLPAAGMATPMTYTDAAGEQYVVIAAGGHDRLPIKRSDHLIAWKLPRAPR